MNRDVMGRQMFANGGPAIPQPEIGMDQMAMMAQEQGVDPAQLQGALEMAQGQMQQIDNAENYEQVINGIRGDEQPLEARYAELTSVVGQEDSQATPESVLTLLQPVMQMAAVDQGIGGLAAEEMTAPIEGPMAEGIMSTVGMGEPDPVNFSQGGPVIHMAEGGEPNAKYAEDLEEFQRQRDLYASVLGSKDREAALADQRRMTKAQMLFDIAQGGFALASPTDRNMSFAERLASSFNPVVGNIGARAGEFQKFKQGQEAEQRALDLQALGQAQNVNAAREQQKFTAKESRLTRLYNAETARLNRESNAETARLNRSSREEIERQSRDLQERLANIKDPEKIDLNTVFTGTNLNAIAYNKLDPQLTGRLFKELLEHLEVKKTYDPKTGAQTGSSSTLINPEVITAFAANNPSYLEQLKANYPDLLLPESNEARAKLQTTEDFRKYFNLLTNQKDVPVILDTITTIATGSSADPDATTEAKGLTIADFYKPETLLPIPIQGTEAYKERKQNLENNPIPNIADLGRAIFAKDRDGQLRVDDSLSLWNQGANVVPKGYDIGDNIGIGNILGYVRDGMLGFTTELGFNDPKAKKDEEFSQVESMLGLLRTDLTYLTVSSQGSRQLKALTDLALSESEFLDMDFAKGNERTTRGALSAIQTRLEQNLIDGQGLLPELGGDGLISKVKLEAVREDYAASLRAYKAVTSILNSLRQADLRGQALSPKAIDLLGKLYPQYRDN